MAKKKSKPRAEKVKKSAKKAGAHLLKAADMAGLQETFSHPWNPNSEITGVQMGRKLGLKRTGVNFARIAPGKESFVPHAHQREEEWLYILYGQGEALIGDSWVAVGAGDFLAFPTPSVTHHLKNSGFEDLVYLMGGESLDFEVVDFPTLKRRSVRMGDERTVYDASTGQSFTPPKPKRNKK
jgi:uncharacterized cupin superfamily protein